MTDNDYEWLIEFVHDYDDGYQVTKRGLDATPLVIKKFDLRPDEVMAFTCYQGANKALTAFHFHPEFSLADRDVYMRLHEEGHEVALGMGASLAASRAQLRRRIEEGFLNFARTMAERLEERFAGFGRGLTVAAQSLALYIAVGGPGPR
ncbi:MAG: hypothetical protein HQ512_10135 [Rhodospirillales bacterium]|nr:hypothetical protein [Rhodospirillales bacterium]